jgi:hypothetical protein
MKLGKAYMDRYKTHHSDVKDTVRARKCWEEADQLASIRNYPIESVSTEETVGLEVQLLKY